MIALFRQQTTACVGVGEEITHASSKLKTAFAPVGLERTFGLSVVRSTIRGEVSPDAIWMLRCLKISNQYHRYPVVMGLLDAFIGFQIRQIGNEHHHAFLFSHGIHIDLAEGEQTEFLGDTAAGGFKVGALVAAGAGTKHPLAGLKINQLHHPGAVDLFNSVFITNRLGLCNSLSQLRGIWMNGRFLCDIHCNRSRLNRRLYLDSRCHSNGRSPWGSGLNRCGVGALLADLPPQHPPESKRQGSTDQSDHHTRRHSAFYGL